MSAVAPPTPRALPTASLSATRLAALARSETAVLAGVALWTLVLAILTWGAWGDVTMDTGYDLLAAARTAHGELPYVDYVYWYGPLSPLLLGGVYAVVGTGVWPAVAFGFGVALAAIFLTFRLSRRFADPLPAGLAAAIVAPAAVSSANNSFVLPHATGAPLGIVLALGALLALTGPARRPLLAGALCGLVALARPELAVALYAGVAAWLAIGWWRDRSTLPFAARVAAGALALPALVYGAFALKVGLGELLWTDLYPRAFMKAAGSVIYAGHAPMTIASFAALAARTVLYAAGIAGLVAAGRLLDRGGRTRALVLVCIASAVLVFVAVLAARPDTVRFYLRYAWLWVPAGAALTALWLTLRGRPEQREAPLLVALVLTAATASTYASFRPVPNALFPDATPYLLPLAAPLLAWLHTRALAWGRGAAALGAAWLALLALAAGGLVVHDARAETAVVHGPGGSLAATPEQAAPLQQAVDLIIRHSRPGEPILVAPQLTSLYVLADRTDVLPQLSLLPGALATPADERRAADRLDRARVVVTDLTPLTLYRQGAFGTTFDRLVAARLRRDFRLIATPGRSTPHSRALAVWLRRMP